MFKQLFSNDRILGVLVCVLVFIAAGLLYLIRVKGEGLRDVQRPQEPVQRLHTPETDAPPASAKPSPSGATSESSLWHAAGLEGPESPAAPEVQYTAPQGAATTPDFPPINPNEDHVAAAYKRLAYIQNNPYAWGGVHSPRATELIAELLPPPVLRDEGHGEEVIAQIEELIAQGDPRAAEVLITNLCEGYVGGNRMSDAIVEIGPPSVPYVLPYLREGHVAAGLAAEILGRIGAAYRGDLGGIVEHILIPKFTAIAADSNFENFDSYAVLQAREELERLQ